MPTRFVYQRSRKIALVFVGNHLEACLIRLVVALELVLTRIGSELSTRYWSGTAGTYVDAWNFLNRIGDFSVRIMDILAIACRPCTFAFICNHLKTRLFWLGVVALTNQEWGHTLRQWCKAPQRQDKLGYW
jgi:hypothetical protein